MRGIAKLYPVKRAAHATPWQVSLSHALFVSALDSHLACKGGPRDQRRTVMVSSPVDPALEKALEDVDVLQKLERHYVFVQVDPKDAPAELKECLERAGPQGLTVLDVARSVNGFGQSQAQVSRIYPKVVATQSGPLTKAGVVELLGKHVAR
jgi:hypothetical protein